MPAHLTSPASTCAFADSLWSASGDKLQAVTVVVAPDVDTSSLNRFVSQLERLFPQAGGINRDDLSTKDMDAIKAALSGPFGSTSGLWHGSKIQGSFTADVSSTLGKIFTDPFTPSDTDKFYEENPKTKVGHASNEPNLLLQPAYPTRCTHPFWQVFAQVNTTAGAAASTGGAIIDFGDVPEQYTRAAILIAVIGEDRPLHCCPVACVPLISSV